MPPLFTATNWTTAVRKVLHSARHSLSTKSKALPAAPSLSRIQRARISIRRALQETYPALSSHGYTINRINPITTVSRSFSTVPGVKQLNPLYRATQNVRMSGFRLGASSPRGAAIVAQVGLHPSPSRAFSSIPHISNSVANAPVVLRAFAHLINDIDDDKRRHHFPRASKYDSYPSRRHRDPLRRPRRQSRKALRRGLTIACSPSISSSDSTSVGSYSEGAGAWGNSIDRVDIHRRYSIRNIDHWFPLKHRQQPIDLPPLPETLVTPGSTTTLSIALAPSLQEILEPTTSISYTQAEVGRSIFSNLLHGILPLHDAFSVHSSTRVYPLLHKLNSLGLLDTENSAIAPRLEVIPDEDGRPDIMHIVFPSRSVGDITAILGETLVENHGDRWFALYESKQFSQAEGEAMSEHWSAPSEDQENLSQDHTISGSSTQLVYPRMEVTTVLNDDTLPMIQSMASIEEYSWSVGSSASSEGCMSPPEPNALTASFLSSLGSESITSDDWSVPPSEADSDLDSSLSLLSEVMEMEVEAEESWSDGGVVGIHGSRPPSPSLEIRWSGEGFGLAQPW